LSAPPPLPDLRTLGPTEKDELIVALWKALGGADAAPDPGAAFVGSSPRTVGNLRRRIGETAPSTRNLRRSVVGRVRRGRSDLLRSNFVIGALAVIGLGFLVDFGVGALQKRSIERARLAALELRNAAFSGLNVELVRVAYDPDGKSYRATLAMRNANPEPHYVMLSPGHVFVQTGLIWRGVPTQAAPGTSWGVVKLETDREFSMLFQVPVNDWTQLIPGYMHLRIQSDMLISRSGEPQDGEIVARANRFNVYLKPRDADDSEIRSRLKFQGPPPVFIPMPPH
jgi:hypothetical protein